ARSPDDGARERDHPNAEGEPSHYRHAFPCATSQSRCRERHKTQRTRGPQGDEGATDTRKGRSDRGGPGGSSSITAISTIDAVGLCCRAGQADTRRTRTTASCPAVARFHPDWSQHV